jgi:hypothetical protein
LTERGIHPGFHSFIKDRGIHSGIHSFIHSFIKRTAHHSQRQQFSATPSRARAFSDRIMDPDPADLTSHGIHSAREIILYQNGFAEVPPRSQSPPADPDFPPSAS